MRKRIVGSSSAIQGEIADLTDGPHFYLGIKDVEG